MPTVRGVPKVSTVTPSVLRTAESASAINVAPLHATTEQECVTASQASPGNCATNVRRATLVSPAVRAVRGVNAVQPLSAPPAILLPTAVHAVRGLEVVTVSAASQATGTTAPPVARSVTVRAAIVICIQESAFWRLQQSTCATSVVMSAFGI